MDEYRISATPEALRSASEELTNKTGRLEAAFSDMRDVMRRSFGSWTGEAADLHRTLLEEQLSDMEAITVHFQEQAAKLAQIAGNYAGASQAAQSAVEGLPTDLII